MSAASIDPNLVAGAGGVVDEESRFARRPGCSERADLPDAGAAAIDLSSRRTAASASSMRYTPADSLAATHQHLVVGVAMRKPGSTRLRPLSSSRSSPARSNSPMR